MERHRPDSLVVIPTYNEARNLTVLIYRLLQLEGFDVLVIDDNSPDQTGTEADRLADQFPGRITVLHRATKLGLGSAVVAGLRHGLRHGYGYVFHMDADLSHDPADLAAMRRVLERTDVVVGTRRRSGAAVAHWPVHRRLLSRLGSLYAGSLLRLPLTDPTGGYRGYRRHVLEALDLDGIISRGYAVQIELNHRCHRAGFRFEEFPITFSERARGRSKMTPGIVLEALFVVTALWLHGRTEEILPPGATVREADPASRRSQRD